MCSSDLTRATSWPFGQSRIRQGMCARSPSRSFGHCRINTRFFPSSFWFDPRCRSDLIDEDLLNRPNMISQSCSHGRGTRASKMRGFAQFVMIMVGEEVTLSATTPEPYMIVSHHTALQCMVMCD